MSTVLERLPAEELALRQQRCRDLLAARHPEAGGILAFSRVNHYYLSGSPAPDGILWLPLEGEPVLLVRKGIERVGLESALTRIAPFRSFKDIAGICADLGVPLSGVIGVEKGGLSWALGDLLRTRLNGVGLIDASGVLTRARAVKTPFERERMRETGRRHKDAYEEVATVIRAGMTERQLMLAGWDAFVARGFPGIMRMSTLGWEGILGQVSVGDNGNFPISTDGTIGYVGTHTSIPFLGSPTIWPRETVLHYDLSFCYQGYYTDKSQIFWSGPASSIPDAVRRAQDVCMEIETRCAALLKPGNTPEQVWRASREIAVKAGYADAYMGLGGNQVSYVGHGIGLESEGFPALAEKFGEPFQEGMTLALEPKIGLRGYGMVGVENVFEVGATGGTSLTGDSYDIVCIEA